MLKLKKVWDPVIRLWHWVLVLTVAISWIFGKYMSFDNVLWHFYLGYFAIGLVIFRLIWGLVGPHTVRFRNFFPTPPKIHSYAKNMFRRTPSGVVGHNPLGAVWIFVILIVLFLQAGSGLFIETDDFFESGPLYDYASNATVKTMEGIHYYCSNVLLGMVILHVSIVLFYLLWKKENLVKPMITGWKWTKDKDDQ